MAPTDMGDVSQAAELLKVSRRTVYRLAASGKLPCYRVGRQLRFREAELLDFLRTRESSAA